MVKKATPPVRRGRPREFDENQVIDAAVDAFFVKGFDGTTLTDLEAATGVDRSTLYNSFGGKNGLYHRATARYLDRAADGLFNPLHDGGADGLADVVDFLERLRSGLTGGEVSPGCLIVNDMAAGSDPEAAKRYRDLLEDGLRAALRRAAAEGVIDAEPIDNRAAFLSAAVIGINLISGHTGDNDQVDQLVRAVTAEVAAWRRDS